MMSVGEPQAPPIDSQVGWLLVQLLDGGHLRIEASPLPYPLPAAVAAASPRAFSGKAEMHLR